MSTRVAAEKVGIEVTTRVRDVYEYRAAYRLALDVRAARRRALEAVRPTAT